MTKAIMKILFINHEFPPVGGGGGVGTCQIAEELGKYHDVDVITSSFRGLKNYERKHNINIYRVPIINRKDKNTATLLSWLSFLPFCLWKGVKLVKQNRYDLVNTHFAIPSGLIGVILSKLFKIPHVLTIIGGDIYDPSKQSSPHTNRILKQIIKKILIETDRVVAISTDIKKRALKYYAKRDKLDIAVIHYGLVKPIYKKISRTELDLSNENVLIISIGRLIKRKGLQYLIQALGKLKVENIELLIIGDGPERDNLVKLSKKEGISHIVNFLGPVWGEKKYQYLSISDLFVLPTLHEGFGIVFLEAMHCGLPIITTDNGGQTDFLTDGENGFLVPVKNVDILAERLYLMCNDSNLRQKISNTNRNGIKNFYIETTARKYEKLFRQMLNNEKYISKNKLGGSI